MTVAPVRDRTRPRRGPDRRPPIGRSGLRPAALAAARAQALLRPAPTTAPHRGSGAAPRHTGGALPGLDGLRAVAVAAVILFHLHPAWLPGGFLGVDVFFVISGFLITTLLVREVGATGSVDLPRFWTRRARRLLPALAVCVVASTLLARAVQPDLLVGIGRQTLGAATFSTNWLEIGAGSDYFHATTPQLFMNLWSLAVEEQFYLVWPIVALLLLSRVRAPRARAAFPLILGLGSAALMVLRLDPHAPTRAYYGTDTHLIGLMVGATVAMAYAASTRAGTRTAAWTRLRWPVTAWAAVILLTLLVICDEASPWTFRVGIPLASLATAGVILSVVSTPSPARALLETPLLRWVGERSYGLYLWHWPVILLVGQLWPVEPGGVGFLASRLLCMLATVGIAQASHRWIETPIRRHGFRAVGARLLSWWEGLGSRAVRVAGTGILAVGLAYAVVLATAPAATSTQLLLAANAAQASRVTAGPASGRPATAPVVTPPVTAAEKSQVFAMPTGAEVDAFGDSILVGSIPAMKYYFDGIRIDALSNRHWSDGLAAVQARGTDIRRAVVIGFGTNAGVDPASVEAILTALGPRRMVVLVTEHGRFSRIEADNAALVAIAARHDNVAVADWHAALQGTTGQVQPDGIHPSRVGQHLYAKTIRAAFASLTARQTGVTPILPDLPIP